MPTSYTDRDLTTPQQVGIDTWEFPFSSLGDHDTRVLTRRYWVNPANYTRSPVGSPATAIEVGGRTLHLLAESAPSPTTTGRLSFTRTYGTIPSQQVEYSSQAISKPSLPNQVNTNFISNTGAIYAAPTSYYSSGGSFYRASETEIFGPSLPASSVNSGSNTRVTCTAHGLAGTETILTDSNTAFYYVFTAGQYTVVDANTIDLLSVNFSTGMDEMLPKLRDYVPGADRLRTKRITRFYLPGVTEGINTPADIPIVSPAFDEESFLNLILSGATGYQDYDAEPLTRWRDSIIYQQTTVQISIDDV